MKDLFYIKFLIFARLDEFIRDIQQPVKITLALLNRINSNAYAYK